MQRAHHETTLESHNFDRPIYPPLPDALSPAPALTAPPLRRQKAASRIVLRQPTRRQKGVRCGWTFCFLLVVLLSVVPFIGKILEERPVINSTCVTGAGCSADSGVGNYPLRDSLHFSEHNKPAPDCRFGTGARCV